jgi:SAM-dependent methyltransferase
LADRVGPTGRVVATDIDVSWIDGADAFEVRRHDVARDDPPAGGFDLVHARLVLTHVPTRERALRAMASALRPGGVLLVEDFDVELQPDACVDPGAPSDARERANRIRAGFCRLLEDRGVDPAYGRSLPARLRGLGLVEVGADAWAPVAHPGVAELEAANVDQVRGALVAQGTATVDELDDHVAAALGGELDLTTPPLVSAWGRRAR